MGSLSPLAISTGTSTGTQSRQEAVVWDPPAQTASYCASAGSQVVVRSRSCCRASMRLNTSCPACLLVDDRAKNTSR